MRLFETGGLSTSSSPMGMSYRCETHSGEAVAVGSLASSRRSKSELGIKALHRELEQVDGTSGTF